MYLGPSADKRRRDSSMAHRAFRERRCNVRRHTGLIPTGVFRISSVLVHCTVLGTTFRMRPAAPWACGHELRDTVSRR